MLIVGCSTSESKSTKQSKKYSLGELQSLLVGKSQDQVIRLIGRPSDVSNTRIQYDNKGVVWLTFKEPDISEWRYFFYEKQILFNQITGKYQSFKIHYSSEYSNTPGKVFSVFVN